MCQQKIEATNTQHQSESLKYWILASRDWVVATQRFLEFSPLFGVPDSQFDFRIFFRRFSPPTWKGCHCCLWPSSFVEQHLCSQAGSNSTTVWRNDCCVFLCPTNFLRPKNHQTSLFAEKSCRRCFALCLASWLDHDDSSWILLPSATEIVITCNYSSLLHLGLQWLQLQRQKLSCLSGEESFDRREFESICIDAQVLIICIYIYIWDLHGL